ncbi:hypothetical protein V6N11_053395 [Hibiscus sabdariffa]|uniref:Uncharacterized protein n=1 Tax=Hibiscus sabdariffa TaxID=183260 RepID=A0ABR2UDC6_9ROSI
MVVRRYPRFSAESYRDVCFGVLDSYRKGSLKKSSGKCLLLTIHGQILVIIFITVTTYVSVLAAKEVPLGTIWIILSVTAPNWIGWFPFLLFDTDWMGREIMVCLWRSFVAKKELVLSGEFQAFSWPSAFSQCSFYRMWQTIWVILAMIYLPPVGIVCCYTDFFRSWLSIGGKLISLSYRKSFEVLIEVVKNKKITYSVLYALICTRIESLGLGQGLSMGLLNLAIVIPQVLVSVGSAPWDQLFGGGNSPVSAVAGVASLMSGLMAILAIPRSTPQNTRALP